MYRRLGLIELDLEELSLTHFKNQAMMLRRLAGTTEVQPLQVLAEAAEPLKNYDRRYQGLTYTTLSPFTRFVDACFPESLTARAFRIKVEDYLETKNQALAEELTASLARWKNNHPLALPLITASPSLREVETLSLALESVAGAGLQALDFLTSGKTPETGWLDVQKQILSEAMKPKAHCQLAIIEAVEKLLEACAEALNKT
jgi:hexosaminidase